MIVSYLKNIKSEYLEHKKQSEKKIKDINMHIKENIELINLLGGRIDIDTEYEAFLPRELNVKNRKKIKELEEEKKALKQELEEEISQEILWQNKISEIEKIIEETEKLTAKKPENQFEAPKYRVLLLETQENERQRISRELHDSTVQNLTSIVHKAELCSRLLELDPIRCKLELNVISRTLRETIDDTRKMIYNLRPMSFDDIGLEVSIERALKRVERDEGKKVNFCVMGQPYKIKSVIGITILRIIQEACSNAIRHADSSLIRITLSYEEEYILIVVEDDGKGFDLEKIENENRQDYSGFGMPMMQERVYLLSGEIDINSQIGKGTKIIVKVPREIGGEI